MAGSSASGMLKLMALGADRHRVWCDCVGSLGPCPNASTSFCLSKDQTGAWCLGSLETPGQLVRDGYYPRFEDETLGLAAHSQFIHLQLGHFQSLQSSVTVPTHSTAVLFSRPASFIFRIIWDRDRGDRLVQIINNPFNTT